MRVIHADGETQTYTMSDGSKIPFGQPIPQDTGTVKIADIVSQSFPVKEVTRPCKPCKKK